MKETIEEVEMAAQDKAFGYLEPLDAPKTPPDAHRAVITGVTFRRVNNEKRTGMINIGLTSRDVPTLDQELTIWVPTALEAVLLGKAKPSDLPENNQVSYRISISAKDGSAQLQRWAFGATIADRNGNKTFVPSIAQNAGRETSDLPMATTIEEFTANLNSLLQGLEVIMIRRERGGDDPRFSHNLEPSDIVASDEPETNPRRFFKKDGTPRYVCQWER